FVIGLPGRLARSAEAGKSGAAELKYEEPKHLTGSIFAPEAGQERLVFKFKREATVSGSTLDVLRDYTYPDRALAACDHVVHDGGEQPSDRSAGQPAGLYDREGAAPSSPAVCRPHHTQTPSRQAMEGPGRCECV